jgi:parallel beta-helix repeat protein
MPRTELLPAFGLLVALTTGGVVSDAAVVDVNCGNTAGDAKALNTAIGGSRTGDAIHIHGTCLVNDTIVLLGDRSYLGDSRTGTVIRQADGANLPALLASDSWMSNASGTGRPVRIAHLTIDGNKGANTGTNALVIRSWLTTIEDLQVRSAPADGMHLTSLGRDGKTGLTSTQVNGRISNVFVTGSGGHGLRVLDPGNAVTDWDLLDSWIASSGLSAIQMDNAAGWKILGNHVYGVGRHGIYAHRCWGTTIENNYIEGFGSAGGEDSTWFGVACTVQGGTASVISGNKVFRLGANARTVTGRFVYIGVPQVNSGVGMLNVVNNVVRGAGGDRDIGLSYQVGKGESLLVVSANNNVQSVATGRVLGDKVTLVDPL